MRKVTPLMLWEAFGYESKFYYQSEAARSSYSSAAKKLNEELFRSLPKDRDEQTDDLQGIPQECP